MGRRRHMDRYGESRRGSTPRRLSYLPVYFSIKRERFFGRFIPDVFQRRRECFLAERN